MTVAASAINKTLYMSFLQTDRSNHFATSPLKKGNAGNKEIDREKGKETKRERERERERASSQEEK